MRRRDEKRRERLGLDRHARRGERRDRVEARFEPLTFAVEAHDDRLAIAEDALDPAGARSLGTMFDEDADAVVPRGEDDRTEVERSFRLLEDRLRARLDARFVGPPFRGRVNASMRERGSLADVQP